jgi:predicted MPP superfamily phosphohydrolase
MYSSSPVRLLVNRGVVVDVNGHPLWVAGADDPRHGLFDKHRFLRESVARAVSARPSGAFTVLLSHRAESFAAAADRGIELTLAGHTHGGQIGVAGRSLWRIVAPSYYLWGRYQRRSSQLYVSAGVGHWFPFRLGCPNEAPVLELRPG